MAYKIYSEKDIPQKEWDQLSNFSFFSSPQFASIWRAKNGEPLFYVDDENGKLKAGIGGIVFGKGWYKRYDSMPDGLYGGPYYVADYSGEKRQAFLNSFEKYIRQNHFIRANINKPAVNLDSKMFKIEKAFEHVLELSDKGSQPLPRGIGTDVRGSKKRGSRVELFENESDLERLFFLANKSAEHQGRKFVYPLEFFKNLLSISAGNKNILWVKAMLKDELIASQITFFEKGKALNWAFYTDKKYSFYKPGYLLADYAIEYSIQNGIKYFSMGSTPDKIESVVKYKTRWGCQEQSYDNYVYRNLLGKLLCGWRRR